MHKIPTREVRLTTTPFGPRRVTEQLQANIDKLAKTAPALKRVNKYELVRELTTAKHAFNLNDRAIAVLSALISFHRGAELTEDSHLIIFPSNRSLCERAHGMAESTLRRNLGHLTNAGLILRHDSPNGKRYSKHDAEGNIDLAFGFDLRPLLIESQRICFAAQEVRAAEARLKRQRTEIVLMLRDAQKHLEYHVSKNDGDTKGSAQTSQPTSPQTTAPILDAPILTQVEALITAARRLLRRKMQVETLESAQAIVDKALKLLNTEPKAPLKSRPKTGNLSTSAAQNERHYQNSSKEYLESEPACETGHGRGLCPEQTNPPAETAGFGNCGTRNTSDTGDNTNTTEQRPTLACKIPLHLVLAACPKALAFNTSGKIRNWYDLFDLADTLRPALGVSPNAWVEAIDAMGADNAAVCIVAMLQRLEHINNPGGYLRALTAKAILGEFSVGPMIMALISTQGNG